jgi:hypothetical protein
MGVLIGLAAPELEKSEASSVYKPGVAISILSIEQPLTLSVIPRKLVRTY